ncbi:MAG: sulfite exporter TauE/SafE family protein [Gammaproteobacteria bacterium]|nr:sulfite exporter TauE/SafE family protein [Gammaproteobacteria bacterium]MCW8911297.1 sulfite exporter TauE/SafE family protein [Gammaproteobacteria bacterium]MCW9055524.1 sulfite exporter TauE/SafE family protein [Gammaproteobacteria bacterium]
MDLFLASPYFIALLFFIIAFAYSSVGLGGGSSYTALMAILGFNALTIPMISLTLNLMVTTIGSVNFIRNKHANIKLILPFLLSSMPMAYLGGALQLPKEVFFIVLWLSLIFVACRIYLWKDTGFKLNLNTQQKIIISVIAGSILGMIAGIVGIGGGIYLVPLVLILGLGSAKEAAACGAIFVWLNSLMGVASRYQYNPVDFNDFVPLIVAALAGGFAGSFMGSTRFDAKLMEKILGSIILIAIVLLTRKLFFS